MNKWQQFITLVLIGWTATTAGAQFTFVTSNGSIKITGYTNNDVIVNIPEIINGLPVTCIGHSAFQNKYFSDITIPNSINSIEYRAFYRCPVLTNVNIGSGVTNIGPEAFCDCYILKNIALSSNILSIGSCAFQNCRNFTDIALPDQLTKIESGLFLSCSNLIRVTVSTNLYSIGNGAFVGCTSLTNAPIHEGLLTIGDNAFATTYLDNIYIPESVTYIGKGAFAGTHITNIVIPDAIHDLKDNIFSSCKYLEQVVIGDGVTNIGKSAFSLCTSLTSFAVGNGVVSINDSAFSGCTSMESIYIPRNVRNYGLRVFGGCYNLTEIEVDIENSYLCDVQGVLFTKDMSTLIEYPAGKAGNYEVPDGVVNIGYASFAANRYLSGISLPGSISCISTMAFSRCTNMAYASFSNGAQLRIEFYAFEGCDRLSQAILPHGITSIGWGAFEGCHSLTNLVIPQGATNLDAYAFYFCDGLRDLTIPESIEVIGERAFYACASLTHVLFMGDKPYIKFANAVYSPSLFSYTNNTTVYYLVGSKGWGDTYGGCPTAVWGPNPVTDDAIGPVAEGFAITTTWVPGQIAVMEACVDIKHPVWKAVVTNIFTNNTCRFLDSQWTNNPKCFYRFRSP